MIESINLCSPVAGITQARRIDGLYSHFVQIKQVLDGVLIRSSVLEGQCLVEAVEFTLIVHEAGRSICIGNLPFMSIGECCRSSCERGTSITCHSGKCGLRKLTSCYYHQKWNKEQEVKAI